MIVPESVPIYVGLAAVDMRRGFDGLAAATRELVEADPQSGALFVFVNRRRDRMKILWWTASGYSLVYKRLNRGTFRIPGRLYHDDVSVAVDPDELCLMLEGVTLTDRQKRVRRRAKPTNKPVATAIRNC
jgi:transposase